MTTFSPFYGTNVIMSDAPTPPNGGKWELMSYVQKVSSHLPPLGGACASNMIDIGAPH